MRKILSILLLAGLSAPISAQTQDGSVVEWGPWWVLLPFEHPAGVNKIDKYYAPEKRVKSQRAGSPGPNLRATYRGRDRREISWRQVRPSTKEEPDFGPLNFVELLAEAGFADNQAASQNAVAYSYRTITVASARNLNVTFGSDDSCRIWLNGRLIHDLVVPRGLDPTSDRLTLQLKKGVNHLFVKVSNGGGGWGAQIQPRRERARENGPAVTPDAVNEAIERGVIYLLQTQLLDGSWAYEQANYRNGQTALAVYALLKSGLRPSHPAIRRALAFLAVRPPIKTYSLVCQMLALYSTKRASDRALLAQLGAELVDWEDHAFSYPQGTPDLSNTQYGALGLWVFLEAGGRVSERVWTRILLFTLDCQDEGGGFAYRPQGAVSGAMTVAGLMSIRACELGLGKRGLQNTLRKNIAGARSLSLSWLEENFRVDRNPGGAASPRWNYYYLYGVERMAALMDLDTIAGLDWYQEGARFLVADQAENGSWASAYGESGPNTCFALLFLSRSTATLSGERKFSRYQRRYSSEQPGAEVIIRGTGDTPLDLWVSEITPAALERYASEGSGGKGLYIERVEYLSDGELIHSFEGDGRFPWKQERFAFQHVFKTRGFHDIEVRLHLVPDPLRKGNAAHLLSSPPMRVRVDGLMEDWMLDYPDDEIENLALGTRVTALASSERGDSDLAAWAVDGNMARGWACAEDDLDPVLTLEFEHALRIDRVLVSHRSSTELSRADFDRATRVELLVKGKKDPLEYDLDPDEEHKSVLMLPREMRVSELRLRVLARIPGTLHAGSVGFAEVELRLGD